MTVTEESRHRLHLALDRTIGEEEATTLMEHLPPTGWSDLATKQDLAVLEDRLDLRFTLLDQKIDARYDHLDQKFDARCDELDTKIDSGFRELDTRIGTQGSGLDTKIDTRYDQLDAKMDARFELVDEQFTLVRSEIRGLAKDVSALGTRMDESNRRVEALTTKVDQLFWHVIALLGTIGIILIGVAQVLG